MFALWWSANATYLVVKTGFLDLGDEDVVGLAGNLNALFGTVAEDTDGDARAREGMAVYERLVDAELATDCLYVT